MIKKMTVIAMAVGVVAAFALPASAAADWKHHQTNIQVDKTINFTGNARFEGSLGGIECQVTSSLNFEPGQTGEVEQFETHPGDDTASCDPFGGLNPCEVHNVSPQTPTGWEFHTATVGGVSKIKVTNGDLQSDLTGGIFCLYKKVQLTGPEEPDHFVTLTPNQPNTFTGGQLHGQIEAHEETKNGQIHHETVEVSGEFTIEDSGDKHTYSI